MNISIESVPVSDESVCRIREQVFRCEWRVLLPSLSQYSPERQLTLVARDRSTEEAVAALTVVETTNDSEMHNRFGLCSLQSGRTARYTQLAVLKPYRGMNLPARLILAARERFVCPREIRYTWLLFDAEHARASSLCRLLGFHASWRTFLTNYGCSRVLTRDEFSAAAEVCDRQAQCLLEQEERRLVEIVGAGSLEARC